MTPGAEGAGRTRGDRTPAANTGSDQVRGSMSVQCCRICGEPAPEELEKVERHDGLTGDPLETAQQERADRPHAVPWRAVVVFVVLAFGLAWLIALPMWLAPGVSTAALMMLAPALATLA